MELTNVLSIPRGLFLFAKKWFRATCNGGDEVGNCVHISGDDIGGVYQVRTVDPKTDSKVPAVGVIVEKDGVECRVQWLGEIDYAGVTPGKTVFMGLDGKLTHTPPSPPIGEFAYVQAMGVAVSSDKVMLIPSLSLVKRVG